MCGTGRGRRVALLRHEDAERVQARLAQQSGMVNSLIRAEVIEAGEFPEVGDQ
jgi:hypothetical protein